MRRLLTSVSLVLTLAMAGCGDENQPGDERAATPPPTGPPFGTGPPATDPPGADLPVPVPPDHGWDGRVEVDFATGEVTAPGFNELVDEQQPEWAASPLVAAAVLLHLDEAEGTVEMDEEADNGPVVVVMISDLGDDSVAAMRYRIVFQAGDDALHRFGSGEHTVRCQPGRGNEDFDVEPCV